MPYGWFAKYKDGTTITQIQDGKEVSSDLIDRDKVESFVLFDKSSKRIIIVQHIDPGQKLIYRRRVEKPTDKKKPIRVCHLVGWRKAVKVADLEEISQSIAYCFEDGKIHLASSFRENGDSDKIESWFYAPVLRDFER